VPCETTRRFRGAPRALAGVGTILDQACHPYDVEVVERPDVSSISSASTWPDYVDISAFSSLARGRTVLLEDDVGPHEVCGRSR